MIARIPFNRRLILFIFVAALAGLQMFIKLGPWFFVGTGLFFILLIGYSALMIGKGAERKPPEATYRPFVSVLIPAHNEEEVITESIKQAFKLRYHEKGARNYEVWVIDDRSTDNTPQVIEGLKKRYPKLEVLSRKRDAFAGKAAALNECLPFTKGEVLLVLDADAHFPPDLIARAVGYLAPKQIGGVQVAKRIANPETNLLCQLQADEYKIDISIQLGRDSVGGAVEFKGNGSFIKRSALEAVGGWSDHTLTEDLDLSTKMLLGGYRIRFVPETAVWEQAAPDFKSFSRQRLRWFEGSMLRYLVYLPRLLKGPLHPRQRFDMVMFLTEFALPIYVLFDLLTQVVWIFTLGYLRLGSLAIVIGAASIFILIKLISAYVSEGRYSIWQIIGRTCITMLYMFHWFPLVIAATFNLICGLETRGWKKVKRIKGEEIAKT